jgi:hypothetical protein
MWKMPPLPGGLEENVHATHRKTEQKARTMTTLPQNETVTKRQLVILSMRGGQDAMKSAVDCLTIQGEAGESDAARHMRRASHYFQAAAVLLDARPTS